MRPGPSYYQADMGRARAHRTHETHIGPGPGPRELLGPGPGGPAAPWDPVPGQYESHWFYGLEPDPCRLGNMMGPDA